MKWLAPPLLFLSVIVHAQEVNEFQEMARAASESLDAVYLDPDFKWDMEGRVQAALNEGINYLKEGTPNLAITHLEEAIALDAKQWVAFYYKSICLKQMKRYGEATQALQFADKVKPGNFFIYLELARCNDLLFRHNEAEKYFDRAIKADPSNAHGVYMLGNHYAFIAKYDLAKKQYQRCLDMNPMMLDAEIKLGILESRSNHKASLSYIENVLRKDSLNKQALLLRGMATAETKPNESIKDWDRLVRLTPGNPFFRLMRGVTKTTQGRYEEAFSDLRKVVEAAQINENAFTGAQTNLDKFINIANASYYVMANVYGLPDKDAAAIKEAYCLLFIQKYDGALTAVGQVRNYAELPLCQFLLGVIYEHKGVHQRAYDAYNRALSFDNDILDAHKKRGIYLTELSKWSMAEKDFTEMLRINPETYYANRLRGVARYQREDFDGAIQDFTTYLNRDSSNLEIFAYRGMAYQKKKDFLPSTYDLLKSRNHQALENETVIANEIDKLLMKKDTATAIRWLGKFVAADSLYVPGHVSRIRLLMKTKDWKEVERSANKALYVKGDAIARKKYNQTYTRGTVSSILSMKAYALVEQGRPDDALRELDEAIDYNVMNSLAWLSRGKAYAALGNKTKAIKDIKKAEEMGEAEATKLLKSIK